MIEGNLLNTVDYCCKRDSETAVLIDADIVVFKFSVLNTDTMDWGDGCVTQLNDVDRALTEAKTFVKHLASYCGGHPVLCFTGENNFRKREFDNYKANRKDHDKPDMLSELRDLLAKEFYSVCHDDLEADDVMGILQTNGLGHYDSIICTLDKDLDQIEGWHYNWTHDRTYEVTFEGGRRYFWKQVLTGDSTDNYGGCYRVGDVGAEKLLGDLCTDKDCFPVVYKAYLDRESKRTSKSTFPEHDLRYLISQIRCALMLTDVNFNFETNEPIMWKPTGFDIEQIIKEYNDEN